MPRGRSRSTGLPGAQAIALVEACSDLITIHERSGTLIYISPSVRYTLGYSPHELVGRRITDIVPMADEAAVRAAFSRTLQKRNATCTVTYHLRTKKGTYIWVETRLTNLGERSTLGAILGVSRDITDRKSAELQRVEQQRRLFSLAHAPRTLMWLTDVQGQRIYFNTPWLRFTGKGLREQYGLGWMKRVHGRDRQRYIDTYSTHAKKLRPFVHEYRIRHRSGSYRWIRESAVPRFTEQAVFEGYTGSCFDITDMKDIQRKLRKKMDELARLKFAVDHLADHMVVTLADGTIIYANDAAVRATGYTKQEMLGRQHGSRDLWGGYMTPDFYAMLWHTVKTKRLPYSGYVLNRHKSGEFYAVLLRVHPLITTSGRVRYLAALEREAPMDKVNPEYVNAPQQTLLTPHKDRAQRPKRA